VKRAREHNANRVPIEVEVQRLDQIEEAIVAGADVLMTDNFSVDDLREAVRKVGGRAKIEASGGITLENIRQYAASGVDFLSVGALTHSAKAVDLSLEIL
jgi:nicotinate-nucleotide pyrophosphorylase (carboxylating)